MHVLFDFDGTLVNSFDCIMQKAMLLAKEYGYYKLDAYEIEKLRDMSSLEVIRYFRIPLYKIPELILQMRRYLHNEITTLPPVEGIQGLLQDLRQQNMEIGILTSNSKENVQKWLEIHGISEHISFIHTDSHSFLKRKLIKKTLSHYGIKKTSTVYIGDETRDIDAANKNNIYSIGVTWGFNSEKALAKHQPSFIANQPKDITHFCQSHLL